MHCLHFNFLELIGFWSFQVIFLLKKGKKCKELNILSFNFYFILLPFDHYYLKGEVQKFAEEDLFLIIFDVFFNAGYDLKHNYDQEIKGLGKLFVDSII